MPQTEDDDTAPAIQAGLYQIAYCSVLTHAMDAQQIAHLFAQAQRNNATRHISGLLMIDGLLVIQWLEGDKAVVRALWAKILKDQRHHCIVELLHRDYQKQRLFPDWCMREATRQEMLAIVHNARELSDSVLPSPWAGAISTLCILLDPAYAQSYAAASAAAPLKVA
jgi:hypothetical protein